MTLMSMKINSNITEQVKSVWHMSESIWDKQIYCVVVVKDNQKYSIPISFIM